MGGDSMLPVVLILALLCLVLACATLAAAWFAWRWYRQVSSIVQASERHAAQLRESNQRIAALRQQREDLQVGLRELIATARATERMDPLLLRKCNEVDRLVPPARALAS